MSKAWWVTFADKNATTGCVEADTLAEAERIAAELADLDVYHIARLPYPARPFLNETASSCPPFCFRPRECAGHDCCPRNPACSD